MNNTEILKLYNAVKRKLQGDWLLVGGALLNVLGLSDRETLDIDIVPLGKITNDKQMQIMDIAAANNFPAETINFAAEYYVKKQKNWKDNIVLLFENDKCRIFRPSKKLFIALKKARGTETDLRDIEIFEKGIPE